MKENKIIIIISFCYNWEMLCNLLLFFAYLLLAKQGNKGKVAL